MNNWRCIHCGTAYGGDTIGCRCENFLWYTYILDRIEDLITDDPDPDTDEGRELSRLSEQMETYEREVLGL